MTRPTETVRQTGIWLLLVVLTLVTFGVGESGLGGVAIVAFLLTMMLLKGQMVASGFMGLKQAPLLWRLIMTGYLILVVAGIGLAYLIAG